MRKSGVCLSVCILLAANGLSSPSQALGFFEMLFGGGRPQAAAPGPSFGVRRHLASRARHHRLVNARRYWEPTKLSYAEAQPPGLPIKHDCCVTAQEAIAKVASDETLRPGDAFMASDGLRVFVGDRDDARKFVAVKQAKIGEKLRARLTAIEKAPVSVPESGKKADAARQSRPAEKDRLITTSEGKTIRLIGGGYVN